MKKVRTYAVAGAAALLTATLPLAVAAPAQAAVAPAATCHVTWGSLPKTVNAAPIHTGGVLGAPRFGHHTCFDRAVFDVSGPVGTVTAHYDDIPGGASFLVVRARHDTANPSATPAILYLTGMPTITGRGATEWTNRDQGYSLEVRAHLPYRVFVLSGPGTTTRVVVDVAHRW